MLILVSCFLFSSFATLPDDFGSYYNILANDNVVDKVSGRFYTSLETYINSRFYKVHLQPNTDYTFISTEGVKRFYFGERVYDSEGNRSVYSFDSWNLVNPALFADGYVCTYDAVTDTISMVRRSGGNRFSNTAYVNLPNDTYIISIDYSGSASYLNMLINGGNKITFVNPDVYSGTNTFTYTGSISTLQFYLDNGFSEGTTANAIKFYIRSSSESKPFIDSYVNPVYVNFDSSIVTFNTGNISDDAMIGFFDINLDVSDTYNSYFSTNQSSTNDFYLIEGKLTLDEISEILDGNNYQNGYNDGYDEGYSKGETSGLESSMFMRNIFFTIVSSPFIFIRNALDFDFLGINFRDIAMIIISATLVAWVIRVFKKGE